MHPLLVGLFGMFLSVPSSSAVGGVDYAKIDRVLTKQPAYKKAPQYALLLFGKDAKVRAWAVLDGETLYLDRNGDGDLTGEGECFGKYSDCQDIEIPDPDGK